jgi:hypothetical protein
VVVIAPNPKEEEPGALRQQLNGASTSERMKDYNEIDKKTKTDKLTMPGIDQS